MVKVCIGPAWLLWWADNKRLAHQCVTDSLEDFSSFEFIYFFSPRLVVLPKQESPFYPKVGTYIHTYIYIIIIVKSHSWHGFPWLSLTNYPYRPLLLAGLLVDILSPYRAVVGMFFLVVQHWYDQEDSSPCLCLAYVVDTFSRWDIAAGVCEFVH